MLTKTDPEAQDARWWTAVAAEADLGDAPLAVTCRGEDLVLWRGVDGRPAAATDRCPHRGARLSLGQVQGGDIECPYHGWRFEPGGRCVAIPAQPGFTPPPGHRACAWQVQALHGLLWVAPDGVAAGVPQMPHLPPPLADLPVRQLVCGPYEVATSVPRIVENFLDTAHFGLVHEGFLGERAQLAVPDYRVEADAHGRPGVPAYRAWQPHASSAAQAGAWVDYRYQVLGPGAALLTKKADGAVPAEAYALWACPVAAESCRVWFTLWTSDSARSDGELRQFQDSIFAQDRPVLESQRPKRLPPPEQECHAAADRLSVAYRRWLMANGLRWGTGFE